MKELWLTFTDENGAVKRISVDRETFTVGRHSENDLSVASEKLSRQHLKIERFGDVFVASDMGSSNGTTLNGEVLSKPVSLKNGDRLNLGGGLQIEVEFVSDAQNKDDFFFDEDEFESENPAEETSAASASPAPQVPAKKSSPGVSVSSNPNSISSRIFWIAPIFGILILLFVGGLYYALSGKNEKETAQADDDFVYSGNKRSSKKDEAAIDETPTPKVVSTNENSSGNPTISITPETVNTQPTPKISGDAEMIEQNSAAFLRQIAQNDPKAFLTGKQIEIVGAKINQFKNSNALAANLKAVKRDAAQFQTPANSQNLKPQFLAVAALAKIGNGNGNPLSTAKAMLPVLGELRITLDNKLADDNLLIIAAYEQGAAGKFRALQSVIEAVAKKSTNVSPREIRTVWFLRENGKLTDAEFEFAMRFLAIGTIAQNPKSFGVNADAITF